MITWEEHSRAFPGPNYCFCNMTWAHQTPCGHPHDSRANTQKRYHARSDFQASKRVPPPLSEVEVPSNMMLLRRQTEEARGLLAAPAAQTQALRSRCPPSIVFSDLRGICVVKRPWASRFEGSELRDCCERHRRLPHGNLSVEQ